MYHLSCWKQISTSGIPPSGVIWVSHSVVVVSHWLALSHIGPEPNITHSFIPETYFCICPGCQQLPETGESLRVGRRRFLGLSESVPHHLVPCGCSLGISQTSSVWPPALQWSLDRAGLKFCKALLPVCFFSPPTRALTLGVSCSCVAGPNLPGLEVESGGRWHTREQLAPWALCFLRNISKDTRKVVVELPLQPQPSPVFVMSPGWVSAWLSCPGGSGRGTHSVLSFERKSLFPSFRLMSLDWNLLFISVYVRAPPCQVLLNCYWWR